MTVEHFSTSGSPEDAADPYSDPEVITAASRTRFAWGPAAHESQDAFYELMQTRHGHDRQAATKVLRRLNTYTPQPPEDR